MAVLDVVSTPLGGVVPLSPWGWVVTYMMVSCVWVVGMGEGLFYSWIFHEGFVFVVLGGWGGVI